MNDSFFTLDKISAYNKSFEFSNDIWGIVLQWEFFPRDTVGKQLVKSADSISANIAEGFGRYTKRDKLRFYRISLGSLKESGDWIRKSAARNLIGMEVQDKCLNKIQELRIEINHLIKFTFAKLKF